MTGLGRGAYHELLIWRVAKLDRGVAEMRIVLIGQAAFGESVLKRLLEAGKEVVGVSTPPGQGFAGGPVEGAGGGLGDTVAGYAGIAE